MIEIGPPIAFLLASRRCTPAPRKLSGQSTWSEKRRKDIKNHCLDSLAGIATERLTNVASTVAVTDANVARGVSSYAEEKDYDLVVLATNGLTGISHAVLGSVAESVVRLSKVPVLTVRGGA